MLNYNFNIKNYFNKNCMTIDGIICSYRYASWALTSVFYLTSKPYNAVFYKLGVILSLLIFSLVVNKLYIKIENDKQALGKLVVIETVGIELLLIPTGGLASPFIWYALNPILVSAIYLSYYFSWINLTFYLTTGTLINFSIFNPANLSIYQIFTNNSNIVLIFILINLAIQFLVVLTKELKDINNQKEESIEHIMSLYQMIETLNSNSNNDKLFEALADYTGSLTKSNFACIWIKENNLIKINKEADGINLDMLLTALKSIDFNEQEIQNIRLLNKNILVAPITSPSTFYGVVAVQTSEDESANIINQNKKLLKFISDLSSVLLDRFNLERIEEHLLVTEEQNRIANEMHDNVSQRLFSISYGIHGILGRIENLQKEEIKDYLLEITETSNIAMKELRKSIYKLSSRKKGKKYLQETIQSFLDSIAKLHTVSISFNVTGDENLILLELKKGLTRIIREACGNSIRHGKCKNINIGLIINPNDINLRITDDGIGFELSSIEKKDGLGLSNIKALVNSYNGSIEIKSKINNGTKIKILLPLQNYNKESIAI